MEGAGLPLTSISKVHTGQTKANLDSSLKSFTTSQLFPANKPPSSQHLFFQDIIIGDNSPSTSSLTWSAHASSLFFFIAFFLFNFLEVEKEVCYEKEKGRSMGRLH